MLVRLIEGGQQARDQLEVEPESELTVDGAPTPDTGKAPAGETSVASR